MSRVTLYVDDGPASAAFIAEFEKLFRRRAADVLEIVKLTPPTDAPKDAGAAAREEADSHGISLEMLPAAWDGVRILRTTPEVFRATSRRASLANAPRIVGLAMSALFVLAFAGCPKSCDSNARTDAPVTGNGGPDASVAPPRAAAMVPTSRTSHSYVGRVADIAAARYHRPDAGVRPNLGLVPGNVPGSDVPISTTRQTGWITGSSFNFGSIEFIRAPGETEGSGFWVGITNRHVVESLGPPPFEVHGPFLGFCNTNADCTQFPGAQCGFGACQFIGSASTFATATSNPTPEICGDLALVFLDARQTLGQTSELPPFSPVGNGDGILENSQTQVRLNGWGNDFTVESDFPRTASANLSWGRVSGNNEPFLTPTYVGDFYPFDGIPSCPPPNGPQSYQAFLVWNSSPGGSSNARFAQSFFGDSGGGVYHGRTLVSLIAQDFYPKYYAGFTGFAPWVRGPWVTCTNPACAVDGVFTGASTCGLRGVCPFDPTPIPPYGLGSIMSCLGPNQCAYIPQRSGGPRLSYWRQWIDTTIAAQTPPPPLPPPADGGGPG